MSLFFNTSTLQAVTVVCLIVFLIKCFWSKRHHYILSMKIPGPFAIPFIGSVSYAWKMHKDGPRQMLTEGFQKYDGFFKLWIGTKFYVVARKPEDIESIFCSSVKNKPRVGLRRWAELMGDGLITKTDVSIDPFYKIHKKIVNPSLGDNMMKSYYDFIRTNCYHLEKAIGNISNKGFVDFERILVRFVCDCVSESMFGVELKFRDGPREKLLNAIEIMSDAVVEQFIDVWLLVNPIYNISNSAKKHRAATKKILELAEEIYSLKTKYKDDAKNIKYPENAVMKLLLNAYESETMSEWEVINEIMNLWVAAEDTIGSAISYIFLSFAMNKPCQDKVFEEIKAFCGNNKNAVLEYEDLAKFPYTEMCIKEALRLFSPGSLALRHNSEPFTFKSRNLHIPADTTFIYSSFMTHRDPETWPNPEEFIPERFTPEEIAKRNPYAFTPFSGGPRKCVGRAFAMMLLKTTVIHMIRKYEFACDWKIKDMTLKLRVNIRSKDGYKAFITERKWN